MARESGRGRSRDRRDDADARYDDLDAFGPDDDFDAAGSDEWDLADDADDDGTGRAGALVPWDARDLIPGDDPDDQATGPYIIPGTGRVVGVGLIPRRPRPLTMRLAVISLAACIVAAGLFATAPLGGSGSEGAGQTPFQALSGAVVWHAQPTFILYVVRAGDTIDSVAAHFGVQIGGIYELNDMLSGQELQIGMAYKIPTDPNFGMYFRPASFVVAGGGYGTTTYTDSPWTSLAGIPPDGAICGPTPLGSGDDMGNYDLSSYKLYSPNPGASFVRGFSWYHNGDDISQPEGVPIYAAQAGEVIFSGWDTGGGGWTIKINNCNHVSTFYAHMDKLIAPLHAMVQPGQVIGLEGSTGMSTGPHLHFTIEWDNVPVDPLFFFNNSVDMLLHHPAPALPGQATPTPSGTPTPAPTGTVTPTPTPTATP